jgi:hypothetical protein
MPRFMVELLVGLVLLGRCPEGWSFGGIEAGGRYRCQRGIVLLAPDPARDVVLWTQTVFARIVCPDGRRAVNYRNSDRAGCR